MVQSLKRALLNSTPIHLGNKDKVFGGIVSIHAEVGSVQLRVQVCPKRIRLECYSCTLS